MKRDFTGDTFGYLQETSTENGFLYMEKMNPLWADSGCASDINAGERIVNYLCDTENWKKHVTSPASYAIGSPSAEMYIKAFNIYKNDDQAITFKIWNGVGYTFGNHGKYHAVYDYPNAKIEDGPTKLFTGYGKGSVMNSFLCSPGPGGGDGVALVEADKMSLNYMSGWNSAGLMPLVAIK